MDKHFGQHLAAPFADADIEWRLQWSDDEKGSGIAVPYVTNRAIQNRLDAVVGIDGWKNEYIVWHSDGKKASQLCGISIYFAERGEWITKYDGAENSDIEPIKGGLSDSMKRAAVQWGVGRYLYSMETVFVKTEKRGRNSVIKSSEQDRLDKAHQAAVAKIFGTRPASAAKASRPPAEADDEAVPPPKRIVPTSKNAFLVKDIVVYPSVKGNNTHLQLATPDGKLIQAHMPGENPQLVPGVWIEDARLRALDKEGVIYNILETYTLMQQAAA